jgi:hypothetical protein
VQVLCDEGVANHVGPKPCADIREDIGEASAGERTGQPLGRDRKLIPGADAVCVAEGDMFRRASASVWTVGVVEDPGMSASFLYGNREVFWSAIGPPGPDGPRREGEEP